MVPTYFRRELRDRVLQRLLRLRTFIFLFVVTEFCRKPVQHTSSYPAKARVMTSQAGGDSETQGRMSVIPATPSKSDLRIAALAARDALSQEQRAAAAQAIATRGLPIEIARGTVVSGYSPIRSEIDPFPLLRKLAARGASLALPAGEARGKSLAFRALSPDHRLLLRPLGIL